MIPREILKKIRQIELRTNRVVTASSERVCVRIPTGHNIYSYMHGFMQL